MEIDMANTYEDFLQTVETEHVDFVNQMHEIFMENGCKIEVKDAKQGYVVTYSYMKEKKIIALMNYVFRKSGMMARIYARNVSIYQSTLDLLPESMKKNIIKAGDCKKLTGVSEYSPTCTAGYDFHMDGENYKKCKNSAFFWLINEESKEDTKKMIENELKLAEVD